MNSTLNRLMQESLVWQANTPPLVTTHPLPTGHPTLDTALLGGWPQSGIVELLHRRPGIGELSLLIPMLRALAPDQWQLWVDPPFIPYAPALQQQGVSLDRLLVVQTQSYQDHLWVLEQALRNGGYTIVLAWPGKLTPVHTRRLQLAARHGQCLGILYRPNSVNQLHSSAPVRIRLDALSATTLKADILKRRGGWPVHDVQCQIRH